MRMIRVFLRELALVWTAGNGELTQGVYCGWIQEKLEIRK